MSDEEVEGFTREMQDPAKRRRLLQQMRDGFRIFAKGGQMPPELLNTAIDDIEQYIFTYDEVFTNGDRTRNELNVKTGLLGILVADRLFFTFMQIEALTNQLTKTRDELRQAIEAVKGENTKKLTELSAELAKSPKLTDGEKKALKLFKRFYKEAIEKSKRGEGIYE
jgi:hypothetical protein